MDKTGSLKGYGKTYDTSSRFDRIDAVEWAAERMVDSLRGYVGLHEMSPESIFVRLRHDSPYSPYLCLSRLKGELNRSGLTSRLDFTNNGDAIPSDSNRILVFDLDEIADQYPDRDTE